MATKNAAFFVYRGIPWITKGNFAGNNSGTNECILNQIDELMMYHEIHRMSREGFTVSQICGIVLLNWRTVKNYLSMSERDFDQFMEKQSDRKRELLPYETFIQSRLAKYPDTSSAQMHDWLKEQF